jgi:hypothetical protein
MNTFVAPLALTVYVTLGLVPLAVLLPLPVEPPEEEHPVITRKQRIDSGKRYFILKTFT